MEILMWEIKAFIRMCEFLIVMSVLCWGSSYLDTFFTWLVLLFCCILCKVKTDKKISLSSSVVVVRPEMSYKNNMLQLLQIIVGAWTFGFSESYFDIQRSVRVVKLCSCFRRLSVTAEGNKMEEFSQAFLCHASFLTLLFYSSRHWWV